MANILSADHVLYVKSQFKNELQLLNKCNEVKSTICSLNLSGVEV